MRYREEDNLEKYFASFREKALEKISPYPVVALLIAAFCLVLILYLFPQLNPRFGLNVDPVKSKEELSHDSKSIWMSVKVVEDEVWVVVDGAKLFKWNYQSDSNPQLNDLIEYLRAELESRKFYSLLSNNIDESVFSAVLSVDQNLRFIHVHPVIKALAASQINSYGFELAL